MAWKILVGIAAGEIVRQLTGNVYVGAAVGGVAVIVLYFVFDKPSWKGAAGNE